MSRIISLFLLALIFSACSRPITSTRLETPSPIRSGAERPRDLVMVNSLYVAPPLFSGRISKDPPHAHTSLYEGMMAASRAELSLKLLFSEGALLRKGTRVEQSSLIAEGKRLGADTVLITTVTTYVERDGSAIGASQPASVAFDMSAVRISDSKPIWGATYAFSDSSLAEDVVKFGKDVQSKGGQAGWATAQTLFERGFRQGIRDLYERRNVQFLTR